MDNVQLTIIHSDRIEGYVGKLARFTINRDGVLSSTALLGDQVRDEIRHKALIQFERSDRSKSRKVVPIMARNGGKVLRRISTE